MFPWMSLAYPCEVVPVAWTDVAEDESIRGRVRAAIPEGGGLDQLTPVLAHPDERVRRQAAVEIGRLATAQTFPCGPMRDAGAVGSSRWTERLLDLNNQGRFPSDTAIALGRICDAEARTFLQIEAAAADRRTPLIALLDALIACDASTSVVIDGSDDELRSMVIEYGLTPTEVAP